jgi:hypothetical protein
MKNIKTFLLALICAVSSVSLAVAKDFTQSEAPVIDLALVKGVNTEGVIIENGIIKHIKSDINGITMSVTDTYMGEVKVIRFAGNEYSEETHYFATKGLSPIVGTAHISYDPNSKESSNKVSCGGRTAALIAALNAYEAARASGDAGTIASAYQTVLAAWSAWTECHAQ